MRAEALTVLGRPAEAAAVLDASGETGPRVLAADPELQADIDRASRSGVDAESADS